MKLREKPIQFKNPRTGEIWLCPDFKHRKTIDGIEFIEVHKPDNQRLVWINIGNLIKVSEKL